MRINWLMTNRWLLMPMWLATACAIAADIEAEYVLPFAATLKVVRHQDRVEGIKLLNSHQTRIPLGSLLKKTLNAADELQIIDRRTYPTGQSIVMTAIARLPSLAPNPQAFCGAGHEDYLLLLALKRGRLELLDQLLIQSCLNSLSLISDRGDAPQESVIPLAYPWIAEFESTTPATRTIVRQCIRVEAEKLVVGEVCPKEANQ